MTILTPLTAEAWLSVKRLAEYQRVTSGDLTRALALYDWNARATATILQDLGHLEVLIRNRYDPALSVLDPTWTDSNSQVWSLELGHPQAKALQRNSNAYSKKVLRSAARRAPVPTHGHIIANLTFGFWTALSQAEREATIWTPALSRVFPGRARGPVHDVMEKLNTFRNRLAHWEPVFSRTTGLAHQLQLVDTLAGWLDPDVAQWISDRSSVTAVLRQMPEPVLTLPTGSYLGQSLAHPPATAVRRVSLADRLRRLVGRG